jgi:DNA-directed RNA polymerase specialized sigma24 family protein
MYDFESNKITAENIEQVIDSYIVGRYAARNRALLKSRFIDGLTYEQLAEKYDLSVSRVKAIVYKHEYTVYDNL